jgi:hypothetical protein
MNENDFLTYQHFNDKSEAEELLALLTENKIECFFEDATASFDPSFVNSELNNEYRIKLKKEDFEKADSFLLSITAKQIEGIDQDYYLFEFSNEELLEIISKRDEWSKLDYLLAQKILSDRGHTIEQEELQLIYKKRIEELSKPEKSQISWIITGYVLVLLGGVLGLFIGWHFHSHKRTLPNGESVYAYSIKDRIHGKRIVVLGVVCLVFWGLLMLKNI